MREIVLQLAGGDLMVVERSPAVVGREAGCSVVLADASVSRRHARFELVGSEWTLEDLGSSNGTWVGGQRLRSGERVELTEGAHLIFGSLKASVILDMANLSTVIGSLPDVAEVVPPPPRRAPSPPTADRPPTGVVDTMRVSASVAKPAGPAAAPAPERRAEEERLRAAELIGVLPGAPLAEVRKKYREIAADLEIRIKSAPTPVLRRHYLKQLQMARTAAALLHPDSVS